jgi:hypothetical protein
MGNDLPVETREYVVTGMILLDNRLIDGLFVELQNTYETHPNMIGEHAESHKSEQENH